MNFFFGLQNSIFSCTITIPKFQNFGNFSNRLIVCEAYIENNEWCVAKTKVEENENFFFVSNDQINNHKIFFLSDKNDFFLENKKFKKLNIENNFTETLPVSFRSNLKIYNDQGGYSSYQSDYPSGMSKINGNILSPLNMLLNKDSDQNFIFFRNVFSKPLKTQSSLYIIDFKKKKILEKFTIKKNYTNEIKLKNQLISDDTYLFSDDCLGIPLFISVKNSHISFEHTHPPHHYILSSERYKIVSKIKN